MHVKSQPDWLSRTVAGLGVLALVGFAVWAGMCMPERERTPLELVAPEYPSADGGPRDSLRFVRNPEVVRDGDRWVMAWKTSAPADSLLTYGRTDPFEHVLVKDNRLAEDHCFPLPQIPLAELCRFRVMSTDARSNVVTRTVWPGEGPGGAVLADAGPEHPLSRVPATGMVAWCDYDGDGEAEAFVTAAEDGSAAARILHRKADGFEDITAAAAPELTGRGASMADFDGDGDLDLLTCDGTPVLFRNSGPPGWKLTRIPDSCEKPKDGVAFRSACFADMDGNGLPDIVAADNSGGLRVLFNTGAPSFWFWDAGGPEKSPGLTAPLRGIRCADLNGDGHTDVWAYGAEAMVFLNVNGTLKRAESAVSALGKVAPDAPEASLADFDGDGDMDAFVPSFAPDAGAVLLVNDGTGHFRPAARAGDLTALRGVCCAAWADIAGNGHPDLVVGLAAGGVRTFLNSGQGTFMDASHLCTQPVEGEAPVNIVAADFTGDIAPDILVQFPKSGGRLLENRSLCAARGDFIAVRPTGNRGLIGAVVRLRDAHGSSLLATGQITGGQGPAECVFGVGNLQEAVIEVQFSDGRLETQRWIRGKSPRTLTVPRGE